LNIQKGNLLDAAVNGDIPVIMQGCNCFHAMESGIAGEAAKRFPQIPQADRRSTYGYPGKLGTFSLARVTSERVPKGVMGWTDKPEVDVVTLDNPFTCINLYSQYNPGPDFLPSLFPSAIKHVNEVYAGKTIGIPLIGCGIGGGNWEAVMNTLLTEGNDVNWKVYIL